MRDARPVYTGSRVTDAVQYFQKRGSLGNAVSVVRYRLPERFRWRAAVSEVTASAKNLAGLDRMRVEEPIREVVLDIEDYVLRSEIVLDAHRFGVDLDRGEILPIRTVGDLRRACFLVNIEASFIEKHIAISTDWEAPIDTARVALFGRAMSRAHRKRAQDLWLEVPDAVPGRQPLLVHQYTAKRAEKNAQLARRWEAVAAALISPTFHCD